VGRPVVAAPVGALSDVVVAGETGWLVEPAPGPVAACLEAALSDRGRTRWLGEAGRRRVEALFTPARRAALVEAVYAKTLTKEALSRR